jgi:hypothetical protein
MKSVLVVHMGSIYKWESRKQLNRWCRACMSTGQILGPMKYGAVDGQEDYVALPEEERVVHSVTSAGD